jgi:isoleucyl-tRNA synthetase
LPFIQHVNGSGRFTEEVRDWAGIEVKPINDTQATDKKIIDWLEKNNKLFSQEEYEHSYPHCWRCETPLLNYATASWFVKVTEIKDNLIKNNQKITWVPENIKDGRFGKWLEQARDWAISRNRYWGTPLPVWACDKCDYQVAIGSKDDLEKLSGQKVEDLHKQFVDKIEFKCEKCNSTMKRIPEVFDCWFESGSMPYGQEHYPFENKERFEKNFPANFIAEGVDQTRGWFYTLIVLSTALFNKEMAQNVIVNGIVLAGDGQKMSKRLRNYPDTADILDQYGADAMRYYLFASPVLVAENLNFSEDGVKEVLRKVSMLLWNVYKFYEMYEEKSKIPSLDKQSGAGKNQKSKVDSSNILDKWILTRLNQLIGEVSKNMDGYNLPKAVRPIGDFIDDLSTWYIRRSRDRFKSENEDDKQAALATTRYVLIELSKVMAPFMPFISEQLWQKVTGNDFKDENKSVHLENWTEAVYKISDIEKMGEKVSKKEEEQRSMFVDDENILRAMDTTRRLVVEGLAKRDELGIKIRQPLSSITVNSLDDLYKFACNQAGDHDGSKKYFEQSKKIILDELNIQKIISVKDENSGSMIEVVDIDSKLTPELKLEGMKREIVRTVNNMRKQAGLTIQDRITLGWHGDAVLIKKVFSEMGEEIKKDTLSDEIKNEISEDSKKEVKINEDTVIISVIKK